MNRVHSLRFDAKYNTVPFSLPLTEVSFATGARTSVTDGDRPGLPTPKGRQSFGQYQTQVCFGVFFPFLVPGENNGSVMMEEKDGYFPQANFHMTLNTGL